MNLNITFTANKHEISRALLIVHIVDCAHSSLSSIVSAVRVRLF